MEFLFELGRFLERHLHSYGGALSEGRFCKGIREVDWLGWFCKVFFLSLGGLRKEL